MWLTYAHRPQQVLMGNEETHELGGSDGALHLLLFGVLPAEGEEIGRDDHGDVPQAHAVLVLVRHHLSQELQKSLRTNIIRLLERKF